MSEENISSLLADYNDLVNNRNIIEKAIEDIRVKVKLYLKERKWTHLNDKETKLSVSLTVEKRESFDKEMLSMMLSPTQLATATKTTSFEKLLILSDESRKKMSKFLNKGIRK
jgi:hypothetical protein